MKPLFRRVQAENRLADFRVDVLDGLQHAFAEIARSVTIAQFDCFLRARGCAGRHGGASGNARLEDDVSFDCRIAAGIENFAGDDVDDGTHGYGF
jgi:hypothetical protein